MRFDHLLALSDARAVFEHCEGDRPLPEHGYCVDDVARALIVLEREPVLTPELDGLADACLAFLDESQSLTGEVTNRCDIHGQWHGDATVEDHWGRALWAWGTVIGRSSSRRRVLRAGDAFLRSAALRSPFMRSMGFAGLGAAEVLRVRPEDEYARSLLAHAAQAVSLPADAAWPWPESRLTYANAVVPEVHLLAGSLLGRPELVSRGLGMLVWLMSIQTRGGHLSVIPCTGWSPGEPLPGFDQQPIEVAGLVDACATAFDITGDPDWLTCMREAAAWFDGANDAAIIMHDPLTGAGYDGLKATGRNDNRGAESTLAYLASVQQCMAREAVIL